jgi:hypothetical protein
VLLKTGPEAIVARWRRFRSPGLYRRLTVLLAVGTLIAMAATSHCC